MRNILVCLVWNWYSKLHKLHLVEQLLPYFLSLGLTSSESEMTQRLKIFGNLKIISHEP